MRSSDILNGLTSIANDWRWLAISWHFLLAALLLILLAGWRPSTRSLGRLLIVPLLSVSVVGWLSGNPFNGTTFAIFAATLVWAATRLSNDSVHLAGRVWVATGVALIMFGWTYPHFLRVDSWIPYLYAAPFGLLPCPTLSVAIGVTLLVRHLHSKPWSMVLAAAGLFYGAFGVFRLGVVLDWPLLFASAMLAVAVFQDHAAWRSVGPDPAERQRCLPGDEFIEEPLETLTHAITIGCPRQAVWPWLVQMGAASRAGWYSYDSLDNGHRPSATRLVPELQDIAIGTVFPALPGVTEGFAVLAFEPYRWLILGWPGVDREPVVTWAFVLEERANGATRLIVRARGGQGYRFRGLPSWLSKPTVRLVHFWMQRKQLMGIARRVEHPHLMKSAAC